MAPITETKNIPTETVFELLVDQFGIIRPRDVENPNQQLDSRRSVIISILHDKALGGNGASIDPRLGELIGSIEKLGFSVEFSDVIDGSDLRVTFGKGKKREAWRCHKYDSVRDGYVPEGPWFGTFVMEKIDPHEQDRILEKYIIRDSNEFIKSKRLMFPL